jgi:hypothetical protein
MTNDAEDAEVRSPEREPAIFIEGVRLVESGAQNGVVENGDDIRKVEAVLSLVDAIFSFIPFDKHADASCGEGIP